MALFRSGLYIVAAKRTAFGGFGGKIKDITATNLAVHSSKAALQSANINPEIIDSVVFGNVAQTSEDAAYLARHVGLKSGTRLSVPALTINRLCGSGFQAIVSAAHEILTGDAHVVLCGGTENMSQAPYCLRGIRFGNPKLGENPKLEDTLWQSLTDTYPGLPMAMTAEKLGELYSITREETDNFALRSQQRWAAAQSRGLFDDEIVPISVKVKNDTEEFKIDEHPRPKTTIENLAKLPAIFKKGGVVTAGNASGISDGAGSLVLASEEAVKKHKLTPLARLVAWQAVGVDPSIMGIGPSPAIKAILQRTKLSLKDIDHLEVNEAFAVQTLAVIKDLNQSGETVDESKFNANGGAIALGHPLAASGARITAHLVYQLKRNNTKYALGSACIGGGQGIAVLLQAP